MTLCWDSRDADAAPPLISVITATYNAAATIAATLDSMAKQVFSDFEYLIVDGESSDQTMAIVRSHPATVTACISEPDSGVYDAWNKGLGLARGRYVAFLGADDTYRPDALQRYARHLSEHDDTEFLSSRVLYGDGPTARVIGGAWNWSVFRRRMNVAHVGALHRRDLFDRFGHYDPSLRIAGDYEFLLRVGPSLKAGFVPEITVEMGIGGISGGGGVFAETMRAKRRHHTVSEATICWDDFVARLKFQGRRLLRRP